VTHNDALWCAVYGSRALDTQWLTGGTKIGRKVHVLSPATHARVMQAMQNGPGRHVKKSLYLSGADVECFDGFVGLLAQDGTQHLGFL
jgi:hypothetical protein